MEEYHAGNQAINYNLQVLNPIRRAQKNLATIAQHPTLRQIAAPDGQGQRSAHKVAEEVARCASELLVLAQLREKSKARAGALEDLEFNAEFDKLNRNVDELDWMLIVGLTDMRQRSLQSLYGFYAFAAILLTALAFVIGRNRDLVHAHTEELEWAVEHRTGQLRALTDQLRGVSDSVADAIITSDLDGKIIGLNKAAVRIFGYEPAAIMGQPVHLLVPDRMQEAHRAGMARARNQEASQSTVMRTNLPGKRADGIEFPAEISLSSWFAPTERGFTAVVRDMTDAQAAAAKLKSKQEEIYQLLQTLQTANEQLREAARHKDAFLAAMSHELRTPLAVILSYAQLLIEGTHGDITERQRRSLETITQSGQNLLALIGDILDLAKIEAGKLRLELDTVRITIVGRACLEMLQPLARAKQIRLAGDLAPGLPPLRCDPQRLNQILYNLLGNAIKFTPAGGTVTLTADSTPDFLSVRFTIADTGIGIAPENISRLFQPFVQIDSKLARAYSGTGLGLAMVAKLAALHGGTTSVESELGVGSKFHVTLPFNGPPGPAEESHPGTV